MSKKILSVMLALVLVLSTLGTVAFAAGIAYEDDDSEYSQTWELGTPVENQDGTWSVDVYLTTDYPTGAIQFVVEETDSKDVIELTKVVAGDALYYNAIITPDPVSGKVLIVPEANPDNSMVEAKAIDGVIATLVYSYTGEGSATIAILEDPKYADYREGTLMALRALDENLASTNFMAGQLVNGVGDEQRIGTAAASPELVLLDGVTVNKNFCNDDYTGVIFGFWDYGYEEGYRESVTSTLGDEYIVYEPNENDEDGTGAVIKLLDSDKKTVLESYVVVVFGDVNGDGDIDTSDVKYISVNRSKLNNSYGPDNIAGNVDGDDASSVDTLDVKFLKINRSKLQDVEMQQELAEAYLYVEI